MKLNFIKEERIEVELFGFMLSWEGRKFKVIDKNLRVKVKSLRTTNTFLN